MAEGVVHKRLKYLGLCFLKEKCTDIICIEAKYRNREEWLSSCLYNIGKAGFFSTDRTIQNYSDDIWHLEKVNFD